MDAIIRIEDFSFPEVSQHATEQDLPALFHGRLADALQKAGITLDLSANQGTPAGAEQDKNLTATPIMENGEANAHQTEEKPSDVSTEDAAGEVTAEAADANRAGNAPAEQTPSEQTPVEDD